MPFRKFPDRNDLRKHTVKLPNNLREFVCVDDEPSARVVELEVVCVLPPEVAVEFLELAEEALQGLEIPE